MAAGMRFKPRFARLALVVLGLAVLVTSLPSFHNAAFAQEVVRRRGLLETLFGGPPRREVLPPPPVQRQAPPPRQGAVRRASPPSSAPRQPVQRAAPATPAAPAGPASPAIDKLENARVVLVVGDFLASGLAEGLETAYSESPGVLVVDRSNGSSGFVRDDYYDWNAEIGPILEEADPAVVVVMIGSNDRQQLVVNGQRERPQTEAWLKEYTRRVTSFAEAIEAAGVPLIWTGLPPFKSSAMSSDMLVFNDIHKQAAEAVGGTFVDIWEGFVDENGAFVSTGPDMNGQPVRLRGSDGINLTRPAKRKVAFYVEKPLNKLLGQAVAPDIEQVEIENLPPPGLSVAAPADTSRTSPISLAVPELDGGTELLGGGLSQPAQGEADRIAPEAPPGRADDFSRGNRRFGPQAGPAGGETTTAITP